LPACLKQQDRLHAPQQATSIRDDKPCLACNLQFHMFTQTSHVCSIATVPLGSTCLACNLLFRSFTQTTHCVCVCSIATVPLGSTCLACNFLFRSFTQTTHCVCVCTCSIATVPLASTCLAQTTGQLPVVSPCLTSLHEAGYSGPLVLWLPFWLLFLVGQSAALR